MEINPELVGGTVLPVAPSAADDAPASNGTMWTYSSGNLGAGVFYSYNNFVLPLVLSGLGFNPIVYGLLSSSHSFEGSIIQPLVGAWSDRTWNRLGRRRPFIVGFVPITILLLMVTAFIQPFGKQFSLSTGVVLGVLAISIFVFSVAFNIMYDPYLALMADITPARQRGVINGIFQALGAFGQVAILIVGIETGFNFILMTVAVGVALLVFFIPTVLGIREPRQLRHVAAPRRYTLRDYWNGLRSDPQVLIFFLSQAFLWFGIGAFTPYLTPFATKLVHLDNSAALILPLVLLLSTAIFVGPLGVLGDRIGLKRVFLLGMLCMAGAAIAGIFVRQPVPLYIVLAVAGFGNAAQTASSYPLLTRLVFPDQMGLYTGLNSTVTSIAGPLAVVAAGALIASPLSYSVFFPFIAVTFLLALIPLALLNVEQSHAAQALRRGQMSSAPAIAPAEE
jgi:maltose/moltooligosaccharide transporter